MTEIAGAQVDAALFDINQIAEAEANATNDTTAAALLAASERVRIYITKLEARVGALVQAASFAQVTLSLQQSMARESSSVRRAYDKLEAALAGKDAP
jgi:hypothetical protein